MCEGAKRESMLDFPSGPVVETLLANAGDMGSIPGKIPRAAEQLNPCSLTIEPVP